MGYVLIAKMAQWNKEWQVSLDACRKIEEIYGSLDQYPLSDIPFRMKNTPESILEVQHTYFAGGLTTHPIWPAFVCLTEGAATNMTGL